MTASNVAYLPPSETGAVSLGFAIPAPTVTDVVGQLLIPATMPPDQVEGFGENVPLGRAAQPAELAPIYVLLASDESSYMSAGAFPVTGGKPVL